jgi:predicted nucleic acid-binding protein
MRHSAAREVVALYGTWPTVQVDVALIVSASELQERHSFSFRDALVVEAARRCGASRLLTEDLQADREIGGVRIENPFELGGR